MFRGVWLWGITNPTSKLTEEMTGEDAKSASLVWAGLNNKNLVPNKVEDDTWGYPRMSSDLHICDMAHTQINYNLMGMIFKNILFLHGDL